jgi:hypothetical protein
MQQDQQATVGLAEAAEGVTDAGNCLGSAETLDDFIVDIIG